MKSNSYIAVKSAFLLSRQACSGTPRCVGLLLVCSMGMLVSPHVFAKPYKGGEVSTLTSEQYGRFTMRMQMAKASGTLSTFFTYKEGSEIPGTFWEEIDIEVLGKDNAIDLQSNIIIGDPRETTEGHYFSDTSLADAYHTYTLEWTDNYVAWYLDDNEIRRVTDSRFVDSLQSSQDLRFNLWAASIPEWVGEFYDSALPIYQFINWFQYESYDPDTQTFEFEWRDDFNSFNTERWVRANHTFDVNLVDFVSENVLVQDGAMILALTHAGETGFSGTVPNDTDSPTPVITPEPTTGTTDCTDVSVYPNWVSKDWPGGAYNHNNAGEQIQYNGSLYIANWYTNSLPGSDASWTFVESC